MAVRSGFFDSVNGDRKYDALDMSSIFDGIIEDGIFSTIENAFKVAPGEGLQVTVDTGKAWFNHTWTVNDALYPLSIEAPDITLDRYDAVVLEINAGSSVRANSLKIVKGTAASEPQKPRLTSTEEIHQYPLAYIKVNHGASSIQAKDIEITVGRGECPFVRGPLEVMSIDEIYAKWEQEFSDWFDNIQAQLEGDIATNLQRQIDTINQKENSEGVYYKKSTPYAKFYTHDGEELKTPEGWQVGDVLTTARTDLGKSWLLCNGDYAIRSEYPKLFEVMNYNAKLNLMVCESSEIPVSDASYLAGPFYVNGKLVILQTTSNSTVYVYTREEPDGQWKKHQAIGITLGTNNFSRFSIDLRYVGGRYICIDKRGPSVGATSTAIKGVYVSDDLVSWSELPIAMSGWSADSTSNGYSSKYLRNIIPSDEGPILFVIARRSSSYHGNHAIVQNLSETVNFPSRSDFTIISNDEIRACYAHGRFFIIFNLSNSNMRIMSCDVNDGVWTEQALSHSWDGSITPYGDTGDVIYSGGLYWFPMGSRIYYSEDGKAWSDSNRVVGSVANYHYSTGVAVYNDEECPLVFSTTGSAVYGSDPGSTDTMTCIAVSPKTRTASDIAKGVRASTTAPGAIGTLELRPFFSERGLCIYSSATIDGSKKLYETRYKGYDSVQLPEISLGTVYSYIRALEADGA